jgi:hypothetical protein
MEQPMIIMKIDRIEHILRAAAEITKQKRFILIGSTTIIVRRKHIPANMMMTPEVDIYAPDADDIDEISDLIEGSIGQGSLFHQQYGYYGDGVSPNTAALPSDWRDRSMEYRCQTSPDIIAIVPDENDIALAKAVAYREKDVDWIVHGLRSNILSLDVMYRRLDSMWNPDGPQNLPEREEFVQRMNNLAKIAGIKFDPTSL